MSHMHKKPNRKRTLGSHRPIPDPDDPTKPRNDFSTGQQKKSEKKQKKSEKTIDKKDQV